jgi:hypothetical protein
MWSLATQGELQGIWFWAALYTFLVCGYSTAYQLRILTWPRTIGSLHNVAISKFGYPRQAKAEQDYHAKARYSYSVSNHHYEGHRISPWVIVTNHNLRGLLKKQLSAIRSNDTGMVDVFYNPNRPGKSFLVLPSKLGVWITFMLGVVPSVAYFHNYYL